MKVFSGDRLVYFRDASPMDWDEHWAALDPVSIYGPSEEGSLGDYEKVFTRFLPKGRIVEAGCGLGWLVLSLNNRGWECEGVDNAERSVAWVKANRPDIPIRVGDVCSLDVPDGYYDGYVSLGVAEHFEEGPVPLLEEAYRVLSPGGVAYFSVPFLNLLRRIKGRLGLYETRSPEGGHFYQYAFSRKEFEAFVESVGFEILDSRALGSYKGIKDEWDGWRELCSMPWFGSRLYALTRRTVFFENTFGHMLGVVCKKPE